MSGVVFKGNANDVFDELEKEAKRHPKIKFSAWLRIREIEKALAEQFGCTVEEIRSVLTIYENKEERR